MNLGQTLRTYCRQECPVCDAELDPEKRAEDLLHVRLFGALPFAFCPSCLQAVPRGWEKDEDYLARARAYLEEVESEARKENSEKDLDGD